MNDITQGAYTLRDGIAYQAGSVVSKILSKRRTGSITLFAFDKGQELSEHSAPFDAYVQVVEGQGEFIVGGAPHSLAAGQALIMPANIPHAVKAVKRFKMLLVMIKS